jgi:DNA-binding transcriptional ArsR family regulator
MDRITLDRDVFKALASDTRLDILKALDVRQKTVTELARELDLNKATVFEHLEKLAAVGLIQKIEEDKERKWVYWQLSWTGRRLLHPEQITLAILLSTAGGALASGLLALWVWWRTLLPTSASTGFQPSLPTTAEKSADQPQTAAGLAPPDPRAADAAAAHDPLWMWVAVAFVALCMALVVAAYVVRRQAAKKAAST